MRRSNQCPLGLSLGWAGRQMGGTREVRGGRCRIIVAFVFGRKCQSQMLHASSKQAKKKEQEQWKSQRLLALQRSDAYVACDGRHCGYSLMYVYVSFHEPRVRRRRFMSSESLIPEPCSSASRTCRPRKSSAAAASCCTASLASHRAASLSATEQGPPKRRRFRTAPPID